MKKNTPGLILSFILAVLIAFLDIKLISSKLLPGKLVLLLSLLFVLLLVLVVTLLWSTRRRGLFITGIVLWIVLVAVFGFGTYMFESTIRTIGNITSPRVEIAHMGVYVLNDNPDQSIQDAENYSFGILEELDRENTDEAIDQLVQTLGHDILTHSYSGALQLADGLISGDCDAIVLNSAFLDIITDTEAYRGFASAIRALSSVKVETIIDVPVTTQPADQPEQEDAPGVFSVFISGIDTYGDISYRSRSDTNILAVVNPNTRQIMLLSTPRDYFVYLPNVSGSTRDKLTHAGIYGVQCSMDTISALYNTPVDYYFRVNFSGFENIIDALGGITVHSDYEFVSYHGEYSFSVGDNDINGDQALCFARERYAFPDGDLQRGRNQMEVIKAVARKALSPAILTNYTSLLSALEGSFDTNIPYDVLAEIARYQLANPASWEMMSYNVTGEGGFATPYSMSDEVYVMYPDSESVAYASDLLSRFRSGERIEP